MELFTVRSMQIFRVQRTPPTFAGAFPLAIVQPPRCKRCWETGCDDFTGPHCARCYAQLVEDVELTLCRMESITIDIPAQVYVDDLGCAFLKNLKAKPVSFSSSS